MKLRTGQKIIFYTLFILISPILFILAIPLAIYDFFSEKKWKPIWFKFLIWYGVLSSCHFAKFYWPEDGLDHDTGEDRCGVCHQRREDIKSNNLIKDLGKQI